MTILEKMKKQQLQQTIDYLKSNGITTPEIGIVLGTGLGKLVDEIAIEKEIAYADIPNFPQATVEFHSGKLIYGSLSGKKVVVMSGRFHVYEGYNLWEVTYGIRTMHGLGIQNLLISNAAGAINLNYKKGDLMLIEDHINLQGSSPLAFKGANDFGNIFADMLEPYSKKINSQLKAIAQQNDIPLHKGVYASVVGPQLETRAEYRMLQILETDAVGMSTVPEVIVAKQLDLPCAAISVLTDECDPKNLQPVDIAEIIAIAGEAEPKMITLFKEIIRLLD
jgi:purine-nucleoside phosphorylase